MSTDYSAPIHDDRPSAGESVQSRDHSDQTDLLSVMSLDEALDHVTTRDEARALIREADRRRIEASLTDEERKARAEYWWLAREAMPRMKGMSPEEKRQFVRENNPFHTQADRDAWAAKVAREKEQDSERRG